jgi:transcriptional coactivator HFI1/ADA1
MVDINPAALSSRPSISLSTPVLSKQSINVSVPSIHKAPKTSQLIPARIDLEPIYTALKSSIGAEQWPTYKETITNFLIGTAPPNTAQPGQLGIWNFMLTIWCRPP